MTNKTVVEVNKNQTESTSSVLRRFSKRVNASGILKRVRSIRYFSRPKSEYAKKSKALRKIERKNKYEKLYKLGKIKDVGYKNR